MNELAIAWLVAAAGWGAALYTGRCLGHWMDAFNHERDARIIAERAAFGRCPGPAEAYDKTR